MLTCIIPAPWRILFIVLAMAAAAALGWQEGAMHAGREAMRRDLATAAHHPLRSPADSPARRSTTPRARRKPPPPPRYPAPHQTHRLRSRRDAGGECAGQIDGDTQTRHGVGGIGRTLSAEIRCRGGDRRLALRFRFCRSWLNPRFSWIALRQKTLCG